MPGLCTEPSLCHISARTSKRHKQFQFLKEFYGHSIQHSLYNISIVIAIQSLGIFDNLIYAYLKNLLSCCKHCLSAGSLFPQLAGFPTYYTHLLFNFDCYGLHVPWYLALCKLWFLYLYCLLELLLLAPLFFRKQVPWILWHSSAYLQGILNTCQKSKK